MCSITQHRLVPTPQVSCVPWPTYSLPFPKLLYITQCLTNIRASQTLRRKPSRADRVCSRSVPQIHLLLGSSIVFGLSSCHEQKSFQDLCTRGTSAALHCNCCHRFSGRWSPSSGIWYSTNYRHFIPGGNPEEATSCDFTAPIEILGPLVVQADIQYHFICRTAVGLMLLEEVRVSNKEWEKKVQWIRQAKAIKAQER